MQRLSIARRWRISELRNPGSFAEGVDALAQAHAIVIAVHEMERLPADFYLWANVWLERRQALAGALVALVGTSDGARAGAHETRRYLHAVACQGRMEFLIKECDLLSEQTLFLRDELAQLARAA